MDRISRKARSDNMRQVRARNTKPELIVRSALHRSGFRFRLYRSNLPGCPDIALPKYRTLIFVHGCFWHQHRGCRKATIPESRQEFWAAKLRRNVKRDADAVKRLRKMGWRVITIWECQLKDQEGLSVFLRKKISQYSSDTATISREISKKPLDSACIQDSMKNMKG